ncbi:hypothetical protein ZOSMA_34G01090 [Zostera marina]|uniref:Uncharacterized protein n=1 Tax=Zostera marina TaxID=29655 RepID=A0A0K9P757_ZOSMR|nr:hypothetical protein ZOSMA_34G01090 [Zostera marina]
MYVVEPENSIKYYLRKLHMRKRYFEDVSHKQQFFLKDFPVMFVGLYMQKLRFT